MRLITNEKGYACIASNLLSKELRKIRVTWQEIFPTRMRDHYPHSSSIFQIIRIAVSEYVSPNSRPRQKSNVCTKTIAQNHRAVCCDICLERITSSVPMSSLKSIIA